MVRNNGGRLYRKKVMTLEKTTEHFTSSFKGNNVLITFKGSLF